ncbi:MAG TPA: hypothetical protein VGJ05_04980 [Fimbriiglobus sp.]|jgi:hypothetical protein
MSVLSEIRGGDRLTLAGVAAIFPGREGREHVNPSTIFRWCTIGVYPTGAVGHTSRRVRLEHVRAGSQIITSFAAVERFTAALSGPASDGPAPRTPAQRNRASERAGAELESSGA